MTHIGQYELLRELGRGAMGVVYRARDRAGRELALKLLLDDGPERRRRFAREAELLRFVGRHPHVVTLHDLGEEGGRPFLVMELVEGEDLAAVFARGDAPRERLVALLTQVADGIHFAHEAGVVHRDLKPANVLVTRAGQALVTDLGMARDLQADAASLTRTGALVGTIAYMSPEQARGLPADRRSDVYALGVMLFEALTGEVPFDGPPFAVLVQIASDPPPRPRSLRADVPGELEAVCLRALAKRPEDRYATAGELAADLRRWAQGEPVAVRLVTPAERAVAWARRHLALAAAIALVLPLLALGAGAAIVARRLGAEEARRGQLELARTARDPGEARARWAEVAAVDPGRAEAWLELSALSIASGDLEATREHLGRARAAADFRDAPEVAWLEGQLAEAEGELGLACARYLAACGGGPAEAGPRLAWALARGAARAGATDAAVAFAGATLRERPDDAPAAELLVRTLLEGGRASELQLLWEELPRWLAGPRLEEHVLAAREEAPSDGPELWGRLHARVVAVADPTPWQAWTVSASAELAARLDETQPLATRVRALLALPLYPDAGLVARLAGPAGAPAEPPIVQEAARAGLLALEARGGLQRWASWRRGPAAGPWAAATLLEHARLIRAPDLPTLERLAAPGATSPLLRAAIPMALLLAVTAPLADGDQGVEPRAARSLLELLARDADPFVAARAGEAAAALLVLREDDPRTPTAAPPGAGALLAWHVAHGPFVAPGLAGRARARLGAAAREDPALAELVAWGALADADLAAASAAAASVVDPRASAALTAQASVARGLPPPPATPAEAPPGSFDPDPIRAARMARCREFAVRFGLPALPGPFDLLVVVADLRQELPPRAVEAVRSRGDRVPEGLLTEGPATYRSRFRLEHVAHVSVAGAHGGAACNVEVILHPNLAGGREGGIQLSHGTNETVIVLEHVDLARRRDPSPTPTEIGFTWSRRAVTVLVDGRARAATLALARGIPSLGATLLRLDAIAPVNPHLMRRIRWVGRWDGGAPASTDAGAPRQSGPLRDLPDALEVEGDRLTLGDLRARGVTLEARGDWVEHLRTAPFRAIRGVAGDVRLEATLTVAPSEHASAGVALVGGPGRFDSIRLQVTGPTYFNARPGVWLVSQRGPVWYSPLLGRSWPPGAPVRLRLERRGDLILAACGPPDGPLEPLGDPLRFPTSFEVDARLFAAQGRGEPARFEGVVVQSSGLTLGVNDR